MAASSVFAGNPRITAGEICSAGTVYEYVCSYEIGRLKSLYPTYREYPGRPDCLKSWTGRSCTSPIISREYVDDIPVEQGWRQTRCESRENAFKRCILASPYPVIHISLASQISKTKCVQNVNYGFERNAIWVKDGCRANFYVRF